jgi:hypothetical protein
MMATSYFQEKIYRTVFLQEPFTPINYYVGISREGVEINDANYQRIPVAFELSTNKVVNKANKEFAASASYFTYDEFTLYDAASGGNELDSYAVTTTQIVPGQKITIAAGNIWFYIN